MTFKEEVYNGYRDLLNEKVADIERVLADLRESGANETKSTAGDKHETALAMLQIEQANKRQQLSELHATRVILNSINPMVSNKIISTGALIQTNHGYFFLSAALGKVQLQGTTIIALSVNSPLGQQFQRHKPGDTFILNGKEYNIIEVA